MRASKARWKPTADTPVSVSRTELFDSELFDSELFDSELFDSELFDSDVLDPKSHSHRHGLIPGSSRTFRCFVH